jgi:hypothetical protein
MGKFKKLGGDTFYTKDQLFDIYANWDAEPVNKNDDSVNKEITQRP